MFFLASIVRSKDAILGAGTDGDGNVEHVDEDLI